MDRTNRTRTDVSRRTVIRGATAGLLAFGGVGTAAAHGEDEKHDDEEDSAGEYGSDDSEGEENGGGEPTASITIPEQDTSGESVRVTDVSLSDDGYISIHDISRFSGADVSDVEEIDELPERDNPICGSIVGISELLSAGEYSEIEVPLYNEEAPAVGFYDHFSEQSLQESQPFVAIPHVNKTGEDEFVCGEDPPEDGAFLDGPNTVPSLGAVNDIAAVLLESDSDEQKEAARQLEQAILDGTIAPPSDDEYGETDDEDEDEENEEGTDDEDEDEENGTDGEVEKTESDTDENGDDEKNGRDEGEDDDESADDESKPDLPEEADDRAHEAHKHKSGFGHDD